MNAVITPGSILLKSSYLIQTLPKTPETFFPFSLVVFAPYAKFLRRFSQNNAEIGLCLDKKSMLCFCAYVIQIMRKTVFHRYATFKYECNNINADGLKKNNIKNLIRGNSRIDFAKVIISHPNIAQNTRNFFPCFFGGVCTLG